jgi:hypothetical protein
MIEEFFRGNGDGHMPRPIAIAVAATMLSLCAVIFWQMGMNDSAAKAAAARPAPSEYALASHQYLPIRDLEPVW